MTKCCFTDSAPSTCFETSGLKHGSVFTRRYSECGRMERRKKVATLLGVIFEAATVSRRNRRHTRHPDSPDGHAEVFRFDVDGYTFGFERALNCVSNLGAHGFLRLETPTENINDTRDLGYADDMSVGHIGYMCYSLDGDNVMFAMGLYTDVLEQHHLIIAPHFLECAR
jgi:hypothetical protein